MLIKCPCCGSKLVSMSPVEGFCSVLYECNDCNAIFDINKNIIIKPKIRI